jgi:hypothetical protein
VPKKCGDKNMAMTEKGIDQLITNPADPRWEGIRQITQSVKTPIPEDIIHFINAIMITPINSETRSRRSQLLAELRNSLNTSGLREDVRQRLYQAAESFTSELNKRSA